METETCMNYITDLWENFRLEEKWLEIMCVVSDTITTATKEFVHPRLGVLVATINIKHNAASENVWKLLWKLVFITTSKDKRCYSRWIRMTIMMEHHHIIFKDIWFLQCKFIQSHKTQCQETFSCLHHGNRWWLDTY